MMIETDDTPTAAHLRMMAEAFAASETSSAGSNGFFAGLHILLLRKINALRDKSPDDFANDEVILGLFKKQAWQA